MNVFNIKKNIMRKLIFLLGVCILSSCSNDFLELFPKTSLNQSNFFQTQDQYILLANGCYVPMRDYYKDAYWTMTELMSDNSSYQNSTLDQGALKYKAAFALYIVLPENSYLQTFWSNSYNGIYNCNILLADIERPNVTWASESIKERCYGEAFFMRAFYYFNLVREFGGVPILTKPTSPKDAIGIQRSTESQVYETIVADLKDAITHFSKATDVEENGRANLGAANALLGKVYLTLHNYADAEVALKTVITSNKYALLANYVDVFNPSKKDFKETIFSVQYSEGSAALSNRFIFWFVPWTSAGEITLRPNISIANTNHGFNQPTNDLINAFEPGDLRKDVSIKFWTGKDWDLVVRTIPYCGKFKPPISSTVDRCSDNFPVIRYSDVLLMYAEALNNQGKTGLAIPYVQQVRNRAGLTASLSGYNQASLDVLIAKERQIEFCFENQRWFDLKRTGKALEVMTAHAAREKALKSWLIPSAYQLNENKFLLPIPSQEITANHLEQNPGY